MNTIKGGTSESRAMIFDIGAHHGLVSAHYLRAGYRVVAVEAHPQLAYNLTMADPNGPLKGLTVRSAAITPNGDDALLYVSGKGPKGETHSIHPHRVKQCEAAPIKVRGTSLGELFAEFGAPEYLKVDIEGCDVEAVRQLHAACNPDHKLRWAPPKFISVELDWDHPEEALEMFMHLAYMGYDRFSIVSQRHQDVVDHREVRHSVGLAEAVALWFRSGRYMQEPDKWYDLHAKHRSVGA